MFTSFCINIIIIAMGMVQVKIKLFFQCVICIRPTLFQDTHVEPTYGYQLYIRNVFYSFLQFFFQSISIILVFPGYCITSMPTYPIERRD